MSASGTKRASLHRVELEMSEWSQSQPFGSTITYPRYTKADPFFSMASGPGNCRPIFVKSRRDEASVALRSLCARVKEPVSEWSTARRQVNEKFSFLAAPSSWVAAAQIRQVARNVRALLQQWLGLLVT